MKTPGIKMQRYVATDATGRVCRVVDLPTRNPWDSRRVMRTSFKRTARANGGRWYVSHYYTTGA